MERLVFFRYINFEEHNRTLDYGLRVHVIVRDTEKEAREYAVSLAWAFVKRHYCLKT